MCRVQATLTVQCMACMHVNVYQQYCKHQSKSMQNMHTQQLYTAAGNSCRMCHAKCICVAHNIKYNI